MREQFVFYKSFDDVFQDLNDQQRLEFISIILDVQFLRVKIDDVQPKDTILKHIWNAQKHSLKKSINGYLESQKSSKVSDPYMGVYKDPTKGVVDTPQRGGQKEEQGEGKEQGEEQEKNTPLPYQVLEAYKTHVSDKLEKVNEKWSMNELRKNKHDLSKILIGIKNYGLEKKGTEHIQKLDTFIGSKIYLDYQEEKKKESQLEGWK